MSGADFGAQARREQRLVTIADRRLAPALEAIRYILDPTCVPTPTIPVGAPSRLSSRQTPTLFDQEDISRIRFAIPKINRISECATSGPMVRIWLPCASDALERIAHLPFDSPLEFDIELYLGPSSPFIEAAYLSFLSYSWNIALRLSGSVLSVESSSSSSTGLRGLSAEAHQLLLELTADERGILETDAAQEHKLILLNKLITVLREPAIDSTSSATDWQTRGRAETGHTTRPKSAVTTPPSVAREMVLLGLAALGQNTPVRFGDPAAGRGRFFAELVGQAETRLESASSFEVNPGLREQSHLLWSEYGLEATEADFLASRLVPDRNLVVANPPYRRSQELDRDTAREWAEQIKKATGLQVSARSDLCVYFMLHAHTWLSDDGIGVWLIPSEFRFTDYGAVVRKYLSTAVTLIQAHAYDADHSLFHDARVTSTVLIFRKRIPSDKEKIRFTFGGTLRQPAMDTCITHHELSMRRRWPMTPFSQDNATTERVALGKLFTTRRGIATGANDVFVLDDDQRTELQIPRKWLKPVLPRARLLTGPIIYGRPDGAAAIPNPLWVIDIPGPIELLRQDNPRLFEYLRSARDRIGNRRLIAARSGFAQQEQRPHAPFLFAYMSRGEKSLPFYLNRSRATYLNNYIGLYPRYSLDLADRMGVDDVHVLAMLREITHGEILSRGRVYSTGLRKVEPRELATLELPDRTGLAQFILEHCIPTEGAQDG